MSRILSLKPNVTREEVVADFSAGAVNYVRNLILGPLRSVGDVYIPFRLFAVSVPDRRQGERFFALDAVNGSLDLWQFHQIPSASDVIVLETRNCLPAELDEVRAIALIIERLRRAMFQRGLFRRQTVKVSAAAFRGEIHIPYWVGFRGSGRRVHFQVIDAVRRRYEGAKVRKLLENWLASAG